MTAPLTLVSSRSSPSGEEAEPAGPPSLDLLFRRYARYVAAIGLRLLGRRDEVDDLVQDVFMDAQRCLPSLRDPGAAKAWLATITVRRARRRLRERRLLGLLGLDGGTAGGDEVEVNLPARGMGPETHAVLAQVYARLDDLPANQRVAWTLRYLEGEPLERVAELCECSLATVKRWIAAATVALEGES